MMKMCITLLHFVSEIILVVPKSLKNVSHNHDVQFFLDVIVMLDDGLVYRY